MLMYGAETMKKGEKGEAPLIFLLPFFFDFQVC